MPRRRKKADPFEDLAKKLEILERELSIQREAIGKLKAMGRDRRVRVATTPVLPTRKSA